MDNNDNNNNNQSNKFSDQSSSMEGVRALASGFRSMEGRPDKTKNVLTSITGGLYTVQQNQVIDVASARLNKYYGTPVISRSYNNEDNYHALAYMFHSNISNITSELQGLASKSGDLYSSYKIYEITNRLLTMPIESYDTKSIYAILTELENLSNSVALGVPLGIAMNDSDSVRNIDKIHGNYMDEYKANSLKLYDESLGSFLKGTLAGSTGFVAGAADSIINVGKYALSIDDNYNILTSTLNNILPNMSREEQNSYSGKLGHAYGSTLGAVLLYGVPQTYAQAAVFASLPRGFEMLQDMFGVSDSQMNLMLGAVNAYHIPARMSSIASGMVDEFFPDGTPAEQAFHPTFDGKVDKITKSITEPEIVKALIQSSNEKIDKMTMEESVVFTDDLSRKLEIQTFRDNGGYKAEFDTNKTTQILLSEAGKMGSPIPNILLETSGQGKVEGEAIVMLEDSKNPADKEAAKQWVSSTKMVLTNSILQALGGDFRNTPMENGAVATSTLSLIDGIDSEIRAQTELLYNEMNESIYKNSKNIHQHPLLKENLAKLCNDFYKLKFEQPNPKIKIVPQDAKTLMANKEKYDLNQAMPGAYKYLQIAKASFSEGDLPTGISTINSLLSDANTVSRELYASKRSLDARHLQTIIGDIRKFREGLFEVISEVIPDIKTKLFAANQFYKDSRGKANDIIETIFGKTKDLGNIKEMSENAVASKVRNNTEFITKMTKLCTDVIPAKPDLVTKFDLMIRTNLLNELARIGITPDSYSMDAGGVLRRHMKKTSRLYNLVKDSPVLLEHINNFQNMSHKLSSNVTSHINYSRTSSSLIKYISRFIHQVSPKAVTNLLEAVTGGSNEATLDALRKIAIDRVENATSNNIIEAINIAGNSKSSISDFIKSLNTIRFPKNKDIDEDKTSFKKKRK